MMKATAQRLIAATIVAEAAAQATAARRAINSNGTATARMKQMKLFSRRMLYRR
jgi:hypothetical protein